MVKVPDGLSDLAFTQLVPSAVIRTELTFDDETTKLKRLILVGVDEDDDVYYVKTTSRNLHLYCDENPFLRGHYILLPARTVPIFELDTAIDLRKIGTLRIAVLKKRHKDLRLDFMGNMPVELMAQIYSGIASSNLIERGLKRKILGPR